MSGTAKADTGEQLPPGLRPTIELMVSLRIRALESGPVAPYELLEQADPVAPLTPSAGPMGAVSPLPNTLRHRLVTSMATDADCLLAPEEHASTAATRERRQRALRSIVEALAIMAFQPAGVSWAGMSFQAVWQGEGR